MKKYVKNHRAVFISVLALLVLTMTPAYATGGIAASTLGVGLKNLVNDIFLYLTIICPIVGAAAAIYFAIRRSMADEQDGKLWEKRIKTAIICGVGGCLVSGVIALVSSYFTT